MSATPQPAGVSSAQTDARRPTAWRPLYDSLFRALWIAATASNLGTWMHNVGADWLMTTLAPTPFMVGLMQVAENSPSFLLALPAGALADIVDRRRMLLVTQIWMLIAAVLLGAFTLAGRTTPLALLILTFALSLGAALNAPAWQAIVPELVGREDLPAAVSLNSIAFNIARAVGPALGGLIVAAAGSWAVFFLNSLSFVGVIFVLFRWRREPVESLAPTERVIGAMRAGVRYVRHAPLLRAALARVFVFVSCASALWTLLPLIARTELNRGAVGYGVLLGGLGAGAIIGAILLPRLRQIITPNVLVISATLLFSVATLALALVRNFSLLCAAMVFGGVAWVVSMSSFNIGVQTVVPSWVRARALAIYLLVFSGSMAGGGAFWGAIALHNGMPRALLYASIALVVGILFALVFKLHAGELDLSTSIHWSEPEAARELDAEEGPVLVTVEYLIDPARGDEFIRAMHEMRRVRRRDGAFRWGLFNDAAQPERYLETFLVESWGEHLRQHARVTNADLALRELVRSFHLGGAPPAVSHLIAARPAKRRLTRQAVRRIHEMLSR